VLVVIARHAESVANLDRRVSGNPLHDVALSEDGQAQARRLGQQVANVELDLCIHTRFSRTRETARLALAGRQVPFETEPLLDDVDVGELDGRPIDEYRAVKDRIGRRLPFPGGESLDAAAQRYARAYRRLLEHDVRGVLVVCHEIPLRYALNAAVGSSALDGPPFHALPNATPYLFDRAAIERAAEGIEAAVG
jgi:broad specificity phosphatase PhoE